MRTKLLKEFIFDNATYNIKDVDGNPIVLFMNYKEGTYQILPTTKISKSVAKEIATIATDLISRKSGKNIAEKD